MRTTLDIDEDVLARAARHFPPGTSKTALVEEGLRQLDAARTAATRQPKAPRQLGFFTMPEAEFDALVRQIESPLVLDEDP